MRYEMLGSLQIRDGAGRTCISARKTEILLAALLIRAGQVVSNDQLGGEIWGDAPPRRAVAALHVHISQLRKLLGGSGRAESRIETRSPGYLLRVESGDEVDVDEFQRLVDRGRAALGCFRYQEATRLLGEALGLWRDPVLAHYQGGPIVGEFITWAEEARLECLELKVESELALGHHREMVALLRSLVTEHPLRETFHRQLMLALYRAHRQGDALKVYRYATEMLDCELGVGPGRALREMYQAILASDAALELGAAA
ncbi:BTAD domain-containing putative transcriptional regulator [Streptomyces sp. NPDC058000]|uniref:AfsR/SARP family transcriptional regulator n=1 Tax=Streptomyces sp. NPDC058000 TaxID=3346299 RepID=UPI0036EAC36F